MKKYVVEVRRWVKQVRPSAISEEYEMTLEEAERIQGILIRQGVSGADIRIRLE